MTTRAVFSVSACLFLQLALTSCLVSAQLPTAPPAAGVQFSEDDFFQLALNLEHLEAEFYLFAAYGYGLDNFNKSLNGGGPPPIGGKRAFLSPEVREIAKMLGLQEIDHIRIFREYLKDKQIPRPLIDIGEAWATFFKAASGGKIFPPFDPYASDLNFLLAAFALPYVGLTAYVGTNPHLSSVPAKELLAGVLGSEGGQDAILRTTLWWKKKEIVEPYIFEDVETWTYKITAFRDFLDGSGTIDDENIVVNRALGAYRATSTNILSLNKDSLSFARNPAQTLSIVYGTKSPSKPGGFWPKGANGRIAKYYLDHPSNAIGQPL